MKYIVALVSLWAVCSCYRRPIEAAHNQTALIPVSIDWSASGVDVAQMHRASVWFFPKSGGQAQEYRMEGNLTNTELSVPVGSYSVLVFNETIDEGDWDGVSFEGTDRYETFQVRTRPVPSRGFYTRSESFALVADIDAVAAWSMDHFEVTADMVLYTRSGQGAASKAPSFSPAQQQVLDQATKSLSAIKPVSCTDDLELQVAVKNLSSAVQATGVLTGMARGVVLHSREPIEASVAHPFILSDELYGLNGKDGQIHSSFRVFGRGKLETFDCNVLLDFILLDGTEQRFDQFDVSDCTQYDEDRLVSKYSITTGLWSEQEIETPIDLPDVGGLNTGIGVTDWDRVIIPIT